MADTMSNEQREIEWRHARYLGEWGMGIDSPIPSAAAAIKISDVFFEIASFRREIQAAEMALHHMIGYEPDWKPLTQCEGIRTGTANRLAHLGIFWVNQLYGVRDFTEFAKVRGVGEKGAKTLEQAVKRALEHSDESETDDD